MRAQSPGTGTEAGSTNGRLEPPCSVPQFPPRGISQGGREGQGRERGLRLQPPPQGRADGADLSISLCLACSPLLLLHGTDGRAKRSPQVRAPHRPGSGSWPRSCLGARCWGQRGEAMGETGQVLPGGGPAVPRLLWTPESGLPGAACCSSAAPAPHLPSGVPPWEEHREHSLGPGVGAPSGQAGPPTRGSTQTLWTLLSGVGRLGAPGLPELTALRLGNN